MNFQIDLVNFKWCAQSNAKIENRMMWCRQKKQLLINQFHWKRFASRCWLYEWIKSRVNHCDNLNAIQRRNMCIVLLMNDSSKSNSIKEMIDLILNSRNYVEKFYQINFHIWKMKLLTNEIFSTFKVQCHFDNRKEIFIFLLFMNFENRIYEKSCTYCLQSKYQNSMNMLFANKCIHMK